MSISSQPEITALTTAIAAALPLEQRAAAPELAALLAGVMQGTVSPEEAARRIATDPVIAEAVRGLSGTRVAANKAVVSFGAGSQTGDVTISGVAGRDIVINVPQTTGLAGGRFWLLVAGLGLVIVLSAVVLALRFADRGQDQIAVRRALAADVLTNISNLDSQLVQIEVAMRALPIPGATGPTTTLLNKQMLNELQENLNSDPLSVDQGATYIQGLIDSGADPAAARSFYDALRDVENNAGELLDSLHNLAEERQTSPEWVAYYRDLSDLNWRRLREHALSAYLGGLLVLHGIDYAPAAADVQLASLLFLEPRALITVPEIEVALGRQVDLLEGLVAERAALIERGRALIGAELELQPDDTWNEVVGKALSLRKLGDIEGAATAFARYAEMFSATDVTAEQYAVTAQAFTRSPLSQELVSAVYVFQVNAGGPGERAGFQTGDIITTIASQPVRDMDALEAALLTAPRDSAFPVEILRLGADGTFSRLTMQVEGQPLDLGMMPI